MIDNKHLNELPGIIYWKDTSLCLQGCNDAFANLLGYSSPKDILELTLSDLTDEKNQKKIQQNDSEILTLNYSCQHKESFQHKNGNIKHILFAKKPRYDQDNKIIGIIATGTDVTELYKKQIALETTCEKALAAAQAKSKFLACMSHDLRTPLTAIIGLAQILRTQDLLPTHQEFINDILSSGEILKSLIDDILDLAKIEADQIEFSEEPFDLRTLVDDTISQLKFLAEQKSLKLILTYNESVPRFLLGDFRRIKQILINLIGNAIKFTAQGHVLLAIDAIEHDSEKVTLQISVEDTGIGIAKEKIHNIFTRFYQIKPNYTEKMQGSGLGLAIVKYLVKKMHGEISVNSQKGKGSIFFCKLTLKQQKENVQLVEWLNFSDKFNFLVIDNDIKRAKFMVNKISAHNIVHANNSLALSLIQNQNKEKPYQVILINDQALVDNKNFTKQLLSLSNAITPCIIVYGEPNNKVLFDSHNEIFDFLNTHLKSPEIIGILTKACQHMQEQTSNKAKAIKLERIPEPSILLVEDNPINQKIINIMLKKHGCKVDIANCGEKALQLASDNYNIIFMDIGLPDISGIDVTARLLKENIIKKTPVIALTAHASENDRSLCISAGMKDFISKPISDKKLTTILLRYLQH